jgi:hypothetical protein
MRSFADLEQVIGRVPARIVTMLSAVDVGRGSEALYRDQMPGLLSQLADRARVASITASSAIEGVVVSDAARADRILAGRSGKLRSRSEQELAGYRDAQGLPTNALLADAGYTVGRYVSVEQAIADSPDAYYQALLDSTHDWHDDRADPWPWLEYFTRILADVYRTFAIRAAANRADGSKQDRVRGYVLNHAPQRFRVGDIRAALPGVSDPTIRLVLDRLRSEGSLVMNGLGRSAEWVRVGGAP